MTLKKSKHIRIALALLALACFKAPSTHAVTSSAESGQPPGSYKAPASDITATITASNWGDPRGQAVFRAADERFRKKYPNVKLVDNFTPIANWSDYINKILTQIASGEAPDVINIATEGIQLGLQKHLFLSLDKYIKNDPQAAGFLGDIFPRLIEGFQKNGSTYLVPNTWNIMVIYYNTKMFEKAGIARPSDNWTWQDFLAVAKKLTTGSGGDKVYGFGIPSYPFGLAPWFYSNKAFPANTELTEPTLDSPAMVESMTWIRDLVNKYGVSPAVKGADPYHLFSAGKVAMTGGGCFVEGSYRDTDFKDYDVVPWPTGKERMTVYGAGGFGIYPGSKNPDLAWEYIKELAGQQTQAVIAELSTANPTTRTAAESKAFLKSPPHAALFFQELEHARPIVAPTFFSTLEPAMLRAFDAIMAGGDPKQELTKANDEVKSSIDSD